MLLEKRGYCCRLGLGKFLLSECETLVKEVAVAGGGWRLPAVVVSDTV
jgi:hypothetical protein